MSTEPMKPEDLVPDYRRRRREAEERCAAAARNGDHYGSVYWGGVGAALTELGDACRKLNEKLAMLTTQTSDMVSNGNAEAWVRTALRAERVDAATLVERALPHGFDRAAVKSALQRLIERGEVEIATDRTLGLRAQEGGR